MPTTSSPWASPSSPAGRRLLQSEPATADDIPVLDAATLALGAALVAAADARPALPAAPVPCRRSPRRVRVGRRALTAAALVVGLLTVGAAGLEEPAPAAPRASVAPVALGRAVGAAVDAETPVAGGQVVVALIAPVEVMVAPAATEATLAERLGTLVALAAAEHATP